LARPGPIRPASVYLSDRVCASVVARELESLFLDADSPADPFAR
jgi:hypothetical protein